MKNNLTSIGKILNFHGIQGEAKVGFSQSQRELLASLKCVFLEDGSELKISSVRFNKTFAIVKFADINDINELLKYKGAALYLEKQTAREVLEQDEYLIEDLIGLEVFEEDKPVAVVTGVTNNGANDFLAVKTAAGKVSLVPMIDNIVKIVDLKSRKIVIAKLEGLIE